jgi:hypothetical protein
MDYTKLIEEIDAEIERLVQVRQLLQVVEGVKSPAKRKNASGAKPAHVSIKRTMSPEGRRRVAEAQRKRWAAQKSKADGGTGDGGYGIRPRGKK